MQKCILECFRPVWSIDQIRKSTNTVVKTAESNPSTKDNKLEKEYKLFHEEFIHNY